MKRSQTWTIWFRSQALRDVGKTNILSKGWHHLGSHKHCTFQWLVDDQCRLSLLWAYSQILVPFFVGDPSMTCTPSPKHAQNQKNAQTIWKHYENNPRPPFLEKNPEWHFWTPPSVLPLGSMHLCHPIEWLSLQRLRHGCSMVSPCRWYLWPHWHENGHTQTLDIGEVPGRFGRMVSHDWLLLFCFLELPRYSHVEELDMRKRISNRWFSDLPKAIRILLALISWPTTTCFILGNLWSRFSIRTISMKPKWQKLLGYQHHVTKSFACMKLSCV